MGMIIFNMIMINNKDNADILETLSTGIEKRGEAYQEYVERRQIWEFMSTQAPQKFDFSL